MFFILPQDASVTKVTKALPEPPGCLQHACGLIQHRHEFYMTQESEETRGRGGIKEVYTDECR